MLIRYSRSFLSTQKCRMNLRRSRNEAENRPHHCPNELSPVTFEYLTQVATYTAQDTL